MARRVKIGDHIDFIWHGQGLTGIIIRRSSGQTVVVCDQIPIPGDSELLIIPTHTGTFDARNSPTLIKKSTIEELLTHRNSEVRRLGRARACRKLK